MKERPVIIGTDPGLVGIITEPVVPGGPACILINAGLIHRVGPNRLHVHLARALAAAGYRALRLDLSGRGDSDVRRDGVSFIESSVLEIRAAMDYLEKSGSREFVLMGICSGGLNGLQVAMVDPRTAGCVVIDGPAYPTRRYYARYYMKRLWNAETWRNTLSGRNAIGRHLRWRVSGAAQDADDAAVNPFGDVRAPTRAEAAESLKGILAQGTRLLLVFSGSWTKYNYREQFADAFPFVRRRGDVTVEYFPASDHTFTRLTNQRRLIHTICTWMAARWQVAPPGPVDAVPQNCQAISP